MAHPQTILEELDELHSRMVHLMVSYPQFQDLEVGDVSYVQAARDIANLKDQPTELRLKLGTEAIQFIKTLFGKMLKDRQFDNIWHDLKPIYKLANNLLVMEK